MTDEMSDHFRGVGAFSYRVLSLPHSLKLVLKVSGMTELRLLENGMKSITVKTTGIKKQEFKMYCEYFAGMSICHIAGLTRV